MLYELPAFLRAPSPNWPAGTGSIPAIMPDGRAAELQSFRS